jgi:protein-disulfide isomerase
LRVHQTLFPELLKEYGDRVAFIYKDFPLSEIHPWAIHAVVNANCLVAQSGDAYWDFADYIYSNQQIVNSQNGLEKPIRRTGSHHYDRGGEIRAGFGQTSVLRKSPER